jgi:tetratricopeptide (TPR) repeat protein
MNQSFNKALYLLDRGEFEKGEKMINRAIEESVDDLYDLVEIKTCYADLLYQMNRLDESLVLIDEVLATGDEYSFCYEKGLVEELKRIILKERE